MTELNFEEISTVNGGSLGGCEIDCLALDDFNRERMEELMRQHRGRTFTPPVY